MKPIGTPFTNFAVIPDPFLLAQNVQIYECVDCGTDCLDCF